MIKINAEQSDFNQWDYEIMAEAKPRFGTGCCAKPPLGSIIEATHYHDKLRI